MGKESFVKRYGLLIGTGLAVGAAAVLLTALGNPANMGLDRKSTRLNSSH